MRFARITLKAIAAAVVLLVAVYGGVLLSTWWADRVAPTVQPEAGIGDFSRLSSARPQSVIRPDADTDSAIAQLQQLVAAATADGKKITIAGAKHSMGGHTLLDRSVTLDMQCDAFRKIGAVQQSGDRATIRVGAGAAWHELLSTLDREGWSVAVMQSNDDFTVGGSLSVNCHGWQPRSPPIDSTIEGFRIILADGSLREVRRGDSADRELFRAVCGGYGLLGVVVDVELRLVRNALYRAQEFAATAGTFATAFHNILAERNDVGLAYGRISVAPGPWFLRDARIIRFVDANRDKVPLDNTLPVNGGTLAPASWQVAMARTAFRASATSEFAKLGRWTIERLYGQTHRLVSRNGILQTPSEWFANNDPAFTEILHEYFVPPDQLANFLGEIRPVLQRQTGANLLNITVRQVLSDDDSLLAYASDEVLGLVMLFHYPADPAHDASMRVTTESLIEAALHCGGSYYLPYRLHARREQFERAYPKHAEFYAVKRRYDPHDVFQNMFYLTYIAPTQ